MLARVFRGHDLPAQRVIAGTVVEQHEGHAFGLPRFRVQRLEIERMAVGDDDIPHTDKAPVAQQGDGALVVPCLFSFPEQRPLVEALRRVPGHETADRRLGGDIQPLGHELFLHFPDALADVGRVGVEDMAENDHLVALGQRGAPTVGDAALVRQSQHTACTFLLQLPPFQRLP